MASYATAQWQPLPMNDNTSHITSTGKRRAEEDLESQSNISSHFKKLRLNQTGPPQSVFATTSSSPSPGSPQVSPTTTVSFRPQFTSAADAPHTRPPLPTTTYPATQYDSARGAPYKMPTMADTDFMPVDETPNRVIISDLDAEIAQIEADEAAASSAVFLADIDKKVSSIPSRVLRHRAPAVPAPNNALVLYREPSSITVPEEMDAVRKAIVAARARAREKQAEELREQQQRQEAPQETGVTVQEIELDDVVPDDTIPVDGDLDADAMEIE